VSVAIQRADFANVGWDREERRSSDLTGWLMTDADEAIWDCSVVDLSYGGCKIRTTASLHRGDAVRLSVQRRGLIEAVVRWRRADQVGLSFNVEQPEKKMFPRQVERHKFSAPVMVRRGGRRSQLIDARDVSVKGCCLNFADLPKEGEVIWVRLPGLEPLEAEVRWTHKFRCGVTFMTKIHPAVFDLMLTRFDEPELRVQQSVRLRI
jgi:hypothetical protein